MAKTTPLDFIRQVRLEASKVTWPARRETLVSTSLVLLMAVLAALFFFGVDIFLAEFIKIVLGRS